MLSVCVIYSLTSNCDVSWCSEEAGLFWISREGRWQCFPSFLQEIELILKSNAEDCYSNTGHEFSVAVEQGITPH